MARATTATPRVRTNDASVDDEALQDGFAEGEAESTGKEFVRKRASSAGPVTTAGGKGWGAIGKLRSAQRGEAWKPPYGDDKDEAIIKFLEDEPAVVYDQHFLAKAVPSTTKRSFNCIGDECPLDEIGDQPKAQIVFNIAVWENGKWKAAHWIMSHKLSKTVEKYAKDPRTSPINGPERYFSTIKVGEKTTTPSLTPVKERDLKDDWNVEPMTEDDLTRVRKGMVDASIVQFPTLAELDKIADEILAQD